MAKPKVSKPFLANNVFFRFWIFVLVCFGLGCRVGEAKKPGPQDSATDQSWSIGVCNPSGLLGKTTLLTSVKSDIIAVSETHLTSVSRSMLQASLKATSPYSHVVSGAPLPPRTSAGHAGAYSGVALVASVPSRALCSNWPEDMYETGRVQVVGSFVNHMWVTGGILYGYPQGKTHAKALERTNAFLDHLVDHLTSQVSGPRFLCGDWNFETHQLQGTQTLLANGWQEVQQIEYLRHGTKPLVTCKNATQKDFLWLSPELVACYRGLVVHTDLFPDHACLVASFSLGKEFSYRYLWPSPRAVPWNLVDLPPTAMDFSEGDPTQHYADLWRSCEQHAAAQLPNWTSSMGGWGQRLEPLVKKGWRAPPRRGRSSDYQPSFFGYDVQHSRWLKQLRRLHNFANWAWAHRKASTPSSLCHGFALWTSILRAPGFWPSFPEWWSGRCFVGLGDPGWIPTFLPNADLAQLLCEVFSSEVRYLESQLNQNRRGHKKWQHQQDPNAIFRDTRRPPPEPVATLLECSRAEVVEVVAEDVAIAIEPPVQFGEQKPVLVDDKPISIIHATDSMLYLESVAGVEVGSKVSQMTAVGSLDALFSAFREQWQRRWCKHDALPHTHWNELVGFARRCVPSHPLLDFVFHPELLRAEAGRKKKTTASSLDGISRQDLLLSSPTTLQSLCNAFDRAMADGCWPRQVISGRVSSLAKTLSAAEVNQYRPITVFSVVYRCLSSLVARYLLDWADGWAHPDVFGNRKGHQTSHLWRTLVTEIQTAHDQGLPLSGVTADIEKCYNCLPRYPILAIALHSGVPARLVMAWGGALAGMERRFKIRDSFSGTCTTSTGLVEGCALSCFGMLLLDDVLHRYVHAMNPSVRVLSFVDNWDFLTFSAQAALRQLDILLGFARLTDLTVDHKKTFGWSTDATIRGRFRSHNVPVKHHARDLGAHVAFSKQRTNKTVVDRLHDLDLLWDKLRMSKASYHAKVRALRTVAWPRGLFGVSSAPIGRSVWLSCRRAALRALAFNKPGVNPLLLLGVVEAYADPELVALLHTVAEAREQCPVDFWAAELSPVALGLVSCPPSSPTMVLLERIQLVGICIQPDGSWVDSVGPFRPWEIGHGELCVRLQWAWNQYVAAQVSHRVDFQGLASVDTATTRQALLSLPPDQQALYRLGLAGGLFTRNAHSHWNGDSDACKWCHQPDSLNHRYFECPQFEDLRQTLAPAACHLRACLPAALALRGWAIHAPTHLAWCKLLDSITKTVPALECAFDPVGWNSVFTDGSCLWQSCPAYRVAAWGAVLARDLSAQWNFRVAGIVGAGPLPGLCQTAYRAELFALGFVLHHAALGGFRVKIFSDCQGVISKYHLLTQGKARLKTSSSSADLWRWILDSVDKLGLDRIRLEKIAAHRRVTTARTLQEAWKFWNNGAADGVAKSANLRRGKWFWDFWAQHARNVSGAGELHRQIVSLHVAVAMRSVEAEQHETLDDVPAETQQPNRTFPVTFNTAEWDGEVPQALALEYGGDLAKRLVAWWSEHTNGTGTGDPIWVSFAHLYIDYQLSYGCSGPIKSGKCWLNNLSRPYLEPEKHDFLVRVKWFRRCLKFFWKHSAQDIGLAQCRPSGTSIQSFVTSASLKWDKVCLERADTWLLERCRAPCHRGSTALKGLPLATKVVGMAVGVSPQSRVDRSY